MGIKKFTLSAADLMVIHSTLNDSLAAYGDWQTTREGRQIVHDKVASILHGLEATFVVDMEEPQE